MPGAYRYRYHGKFVSESEGKRLSNLRNVAQYVTRSPVQERHYRYHGQFVSKEKAQSIAHLPEARKYLTTEIKRGKEARAVEGYFAPRREREIAEKVKAAIEADRRTLEEKIAAARAAHEKPSARRQAAQKKNEEFQVQEIARAAAREAVDEDISIDEALDSQGFDEGDYDYFDYDAVSSYAEGYLDYGDEYDFFDMYDLETEDLYPGE
jgi:hypothetical protein